MNVRFTNDNMSSSVVGVLNAFLKDLSNFSYSKVLFLGDNVNTSLSIIGHKTNLKKSLRSSSFSLDNLVPSVYFKKRY